MNGNILTGNIHIKLFQKILLKNKDKRILKNF